MARTVDPEALKSYAKHVFDALGGAMTSIMIWLGDRLGLYRALADGEPRTSVDLAAQTGLNERWVREWLAQQGASRILEYRGNGRVAPGAGGGGGPGGPPQATGGVGFFVPPASVH